MFVIASYPRSGNHLVRFLVEYLTGRPTLGCYGNCVDTPIYQRQFTETPGILSHVRGEPIARKVHFAKEFRQVFRIHHPISGIIFIRREPIEAILSNTDPRSAGFLKINKSVRRYFSLERCVRRIRLPVLHISFEKLTAPEQSDFLPEVRRLARFISVDADLPMLEFERLRRVARQSLKRPTESSNRHYWRLSQFGRQRRRVRALIALHSLASKIL